MIIYDFDGTLFDTRESVEAMYGYIADMVGIKLSKIEFDFCMEHSMPVTMKEIFHTDTKALSDVDFTQFYDLITPFPYMIDTVTELSHSWTLAISTNRISGVSYVLDKYGLNYFKYATDPHFYPPKPDPKGVNSIKDCSILIGDSQIDLQTALNADIPFIAFRNKKLPTDYHINNHKQTLDTIELIKYNY